MTHTLANGISICTVDVKEGAKNFRIVRGAPDYLYFDDSYGHDGSCEKPLPPGKWTLLGRFNSIRERTWSKVFPKTINQTPATLQARSLIPGNPVVLIEKK